MPDPDLGPEPPTVLPTGAAVPTGEAGGDGGMWHVTVTVAGDPVPEPEIRAGLERLEHEHPFLLAGRYAPDRAEVRYWEEAPDAASVVRLGLALWDEHRASARLPYWRVVGIEVVDRETFHRRVVHGRGHPVAPVGPVAVVGVTRF